MNVLKESVNSQELIMTLEDCVFALDKTFTFSRSDFQ